MIGSFTFENLPCRVVFGSGTLSAAKAEIERLGGKRALVLTDDRSRRPQGAKLWRRARSRFMRHLRGRTDAHAVEVTERSAGGDEGVRRPIGVVSLGGGSTTGPRQGAGLAHRRQPALHSHHLCRLGDDADRRPDRERPEDHGARRTAVLPETVIYDVDLT
jgi:alcohol dehydrogenase class IV